MRVSIVRPDGPAHPVESPAWARLGRAPGPTPAQSTGAQPEALSRDDPPDSAARDWEDEARSLEERVARLSASIPDREMKAHAAGMAEGARQAEAAALERARREARQEYEQALESAAAAARQVLETRRAMRRQMEEDVARLAVSVARRILHRELHVDPEALVGVVKSVVERIDARQVHRLCAAPYDLPFLKGHFASLGLPDRVEVVADPGLKRGSLVLETSRGHLDSSIETQLQEIDRGFADLVRRTT